VELPASGKAPHGLKWSELQRLTRMLGLGLLTVRFYKRKPPAVEVLCDPGPYAPRQSKKAALLLMNEFRERSGDYNVGGSSKRKLVTAYREKVLLCARLLHQHGPLSTRQLRELTGNGKVAGLLQKNYYLWFNRVKIGVYELTPAGEEALKQFPDVMAEKV
jgi:hypothetical protein